MGFLIAYLLGILTAVHPKNDHSSRTHTPANKSSCDPFPDRPISVVSIPPPQNDEEKAKEKNKRRRETVKSWAEIIGAFILGIYAGFTILMWHEMRTSTEAANRNFRRDERSWMAFKFVEGNMTFTIGKPFLVPTEITNTGKTPAKNVHGNIVVGILKKGEHLDFIYTPGHANYAVTAGTIFPNGKIVESFEAIKHGQERAEAIIFTAPLKDEIFSGQSFIVVHGRIAYNDIFGIEHWTTYCRYVLHPELISEECIRYNDTDDN